MQLLLQAALQLATCVAEAEFAASFGDMHLGLASRSTKDFKFGGRINVKKHVNIGLEVCNF